MILTIAMKMSVLVEISDNEALTSIAHNRLVYLNYILPLGNFCCTLMDLETD